MIFHKKGLGLSLLMIAVLILAGPAAFSQQFQASKDSVNKQVSDSLLPNLIIKVASYSATIDHTGFLVRRKFNITPISLNLPEIERKVKGFKSRLEKKGSEMNQRSLNSGVIMLNEIKEDLFSYKQILKTYSSELTKSNAEVKKILLDPALDVPVSDSILQQQLQDLRTEGNALDALQQKTLLQVHLLLNKVSVNLLQSTDIISDMQYLTITLKVGMWDQEESPLFKVKQKEYKNSLDEIAVLAITRSGKILSIYLNGKWNVITVGLLIFIFILAWTLINMRRIKKQENITSVTEPLRFVNKGVWLACVFAFFTYLPFLFTSPPMAFLHACGLLRMATLFFLIYPYLTRPSKIIWIILCLLWVYYAFDDILLESAFGARWGLFLAGISLAAVCVKLIFTKKPNFISLQESPATKALLVFTLAQVILSIIFNLTGRASLAKIFGVSAIQCLMFGVSLKVFCTMVLEAIYLQSEAYRESRFSEFINFKVLQNRFLRVLWILATVAWTLSLMHNLTLYQVIMQLFDSFFHQTRTIGSMVFTFKSVAVFICIIWFSSMISGFINFFFGNEKLRDSNKRSKVGSMMLLIRLAIWTLGFCIAVAAAGIPLDKLSLMLGALGVGIGFGLQNIVNNLVSGVILAFERPIQVGDLIEVGGKIGVVKEIGVRSSKINNNEGADIIVPNGDLLSQHLINWTMQDRHKQIEFVIGVPYGVNIKTCRLRYRNY